MDRYQVTGVKVTPEGVEVGGDGGNFTAASEEEAENLFRDCHKPDMPGVWEWHITVTES